MTVVDLGLNIVPTEYTVPVAELAPWAEANGFTSIFFPEHSHFPVSRDTPYLLGGELPQYYKEHADPLVCMAVAAATTKRIQVGTCVLLVPEHHPISLAKTLSSIDRVSGGRVVVGAGGGWNREELRNHGVTFKNRWSVTRDKVRAMQEIWRNEVSEYHGEFVDFDPIWSWPKPVQPRGPRVLLGGTLNERLIDDVATYADGWIPLDGLHTDLDTGVQKIRIRVEESGRSPADLDFTVLTRMQPDGPAATAQRVQELASWGFNRVLLLVEARPAHEQWSDLQHAVEAKRHLEPRHLIPVGR